MAEEFDFRKEEYVSLRKEVENSLAELSNLERNCVVAAATAYAWVATTVSLKAPIVQTAWLIPAILPVYGALRSKDINVHLSLLGRYLKSVEFKSLPAESPDQQQGWQHYFEKHGSALATKTRKRFWASFVVLAILCSAAGYWFARSPEMKPPVAAEASQRGCDTFTFATT